MSENYLTIKVIIFLTFTLITFIIVLRNRKLTHTTGINKMTEKTAKAVNYTDENVENMVATYALATTAEARKEAVAEIAKDLGKTVKSVIAKLSRENVYVKAEKATKTGAKVETKAEIVAAIAANLELDAESIKSLSNATKATLVALREAS